MKEAHIVVDVQNVYFPNKKLPIWRPVETAEHIATLIKKFRDDGKEVIYVRHITKKDFLPKDRYELEINDIVKPLPIDKIVFKEENSAFVRTEFKEYL